METIREFIGIFLHLRSHLGDLISNHGPYIYAILFLVIFCETGLVVTPFLPGDSLLFAAGAFAAMGRLDIGLMMASLSVAAIAGDTVNYHIGKYLGPRAFKWKKSRVFNPEHLVRTRDFYEKYGVKTIILARFVPIVRTFAPFVAGIGMMEYRRFIIYNVVGGLAWVGICLFSGYWFGNQPWVTKNFEAVVVAIILISVMPLAYEYWASRRKGRAGG